ncbi:MAG: zinc-binding dehydrogenase, partial [SAR324 cluster bacterium]|nr:zinc-binding dehydrogenase [SAR324 cluster bacterium]
PVGLAATMFGTVMGARVIAVDVIPERLRLAEQAGAWKTVDNSDGTAVEQIRALTHGEGADATLEAAGLPATRVAAVEAARIFGRACLVGEGGEVTYEPTPHIIQRAAAYGANIRRQAPGTLHFKQLPIGLLRLANSLKRDGEGRAEPTQPFCIRHPDPLLKKRKTMHAFGDVDKRRPFHDLRPN